MTRHATNTKQKQTENTRISGQVVYTPLSQLPDRFTYGPHTKQMSEYLSRRFSAHSYGWFKRGKEIEYNREWIPESDKGAARWGRDPKRYRWVEHPSQGLRFIGKAHEIRGNNTPWYRDDAQTWERSLIDHTGWFVDNWQDETVCGEVYQLPAREGRPQYVPAIEDHNGNDGATLDFHSVTDDLKDAVRWADSMAERYAEDKREYQARESANMRIEEIEAEVKTAREEFKALAREVRMNCGKLTGLAEVKKLIRRAYKAMRAECRELGKEKRKLQEDFWAAVPNGY